MHTAGLPPNYLFPPTADHDLSDLTSLDVLLAGPTGTPYANGVWRLHLAIPPNYPTAPPTAAFRTRLWHPNIDEATGAVCVETLKRDWSSTLKLRDVLVTISCLLIQPNPASALNEAAGKLASEDWDGFCRRAKLMTDIHAAVPKDIAQEVKEAQMRGEDLEPRDVKSDAGDRAGKDKEKAITPVVAKVQQGLAVPKDDEENRRRRGDTAEPMSDPESDWIPGPVKSPKAFTTGRDNILGIKGLDDSMQLDSSPKKVVLDGAKAGGEEEMGTVDDSDPFVIVSTKHKPTANASFSLRVPSGSAAKSTPGLPSNTATPDTLKFSSTNPFSAIQPNNQADPLLKEFSWSWQDSEILHGTDTDFQDEDDVLTRSELRKRMAGEDFEARRKWELKRFKKTGYDLAKYNRGDFGPRTGIGRL